MSQSTGNSRIPLTPELKEVALAALKAYLNAPADAEGRTPTDIEVEGDRHRVEVIEKILTPLLAGYLAKEVSAADFKRKVDGTNKQNPLWGFSGIKGQMFFNMLMNTADDASECDNQLRSAIREPANEEDAVTQLRNFRSYVERVGERFVAGGGDARGRPKPSSVPFFVSYFWQIQRRDVWPVYYTNTVQVVEGMNLWAATGETADDYLAYKRLHEILVNLFSEAAGKPFSLYDVEHVFWFKGGKMLDASSAAAVASLTRPVPAIQPSGAATSTQPPLTQALQSSLHSDSYVPPIVAVIPKLALNDPELQEAARRSGTTLERAFEKSINAAFTVLGFETQLLGQGMGRVPDGQAIAVDESYALLWDAKARSDSYRMGTDDRVMRQYIDTQSRGLKRGRAVRNIYYLIISSGFSDEFDDLIRTLKMETNVDEVCLVEAAALVAIVDQKLRAPLSVNLGSDGIQRLFSSSGRITASDVLKHLA
ncbi:MAG: hypothetical protein WD886_06355 [Burkholderiales bacterium]